jgi:hypothetical protein
MATIPGDNQQSSHSKARAEVFKRLVYDRAIKHGAVRLFLLLYTYTNTNGKCWPGQRRLRRILGCSRSSIKPWVESLRGGGYLSTSQEITSRGRRTIYPLNLGMFPKVGTPGVPGFSRGVPGFNGGVPKTGNETNSIELNSNDRKVKKKW